jgi:hypothetical protein
MARNREPPTYTADDVRAFFAWSDWLDYFVLRPLSHIAGNWETTWDHDEKRYEPEPDSFADDLNCVIELIATTPRPLRYHDHEDMLAERVIRELKWPIQKKGGRWFGADYASILEQGASRDLNQMTLLAAATGRVHAALDYDQKHVDDMEEGHFQMLTALLTNIIYHRYRDGASLIVEYDSE